jgi:hypothetical protein
MEMEMERFDWGGGGIMWMDDGDGWSIKKNITNFLSIHKKSKA